MNLLKGRVKNRVKVMIGLISHKKVIYYRLKILVGGSR